MDKDTSINEDLKLEINNLIWMNSEGSITLHEAEKRSITVMQVIMGIDWFDSWWAENGEEFLRISSAIGDSHTRDKRIAEIAFRAALSL